MEKVRVLGSYKPSGFRQSSVIDKEGIAPTLTECHGQVHAVIERESNSLKIKSATKLGYILANDGDGVDLEQRKGRRGTVQKDLSLTIKTQSDVVVVTSSYELTDAMKKYINSYDDKYICNGNNMQVNRDVAVSKTTREGSSRADTSDYLSPDLESNENIANKDLTKLRIRKLTETECMRLMGVKDSDSNKMTCSKSQKYKQAGNSIVVQVLMGIFAELLGIPKGEYLAAIKKSTQELKQ